MFYKLHYDNEQITPMHTCKAVLNYQTVQSNILGSFVIAPTNELVDRFDQQYKSSIIKRFITFLVKILITDMVKFYAAISGIQQRRQQQSLHLPLVTTSNTAFSMQTLRLKFSNALHTIDYTKLHQDCGDAAQQHTSK